MSSFKLLMGAAALCGGLIVTSASAMPIAPLDTASNVDQVRMVCNAYGRCWWRPNYYYGGYVAPRFYGGYGRGYGYGYRGYGRRW